MDAGNSQKLLKISAHGCDPRAGHSGEPTERAEAQRTEGPASSKREYGALQKVPAGAIPGRGNELLRGLLRDEAQRGHLKIGVVALLPAAVAMRIHLNQSRTQGTGTNCGPQQVRSHLGELVVLH